MKARMSHSSIHLFIHLSICRLSGYLDEARTRLKGIDSRGTFGGDGAMNIAPAPLPDWLGWRPNLPSPSSSFSPKYFLLTFFKIHESYILKTKQDSHSDQFHVWFNKKEHKFKRKGKLLPQVPGSRAGCRWKSPAWYPSLDSAPKVRPYFKPWYKLSIFFRCLCQYDYKCLNVDWNWIFEAAQVDINDTEKIFLISLKTQTSDPHQVEINEERLVKITWTEDQLMENRACTDLFEVGLFLSLFGDFR